MMNFVAKYQLIVSPVFAYLTSFRVLLHTLYPKVHNSEGKHRRLFHWPSSQMQIEYSPIG